MPPQLREREIDEEVWFCRASLTECELYRLFFGEEKLTEALNDRPGWDFESCWCDHLRPKLVVE